MKTVAPINPPLNPPEEGNNDAPAIEMREVAFGAMRDQSMTVAEEVNWTVNAGDFWVVAGPQRSGKTDFLLLAAGLMSATHGTYRCLGAEMPIFEDERLADRRRVGLVFDSGQLFKQMTIAENIALPLRYHENLTSSEAQSRVQAMLEWLELCPVAGCTPASVARNWQLRAGLARALILQPEVLFLDDPLAGLDARHAAWWLNFLGQLGQGKTPLHNRPTTLVATSESFRPWRNRADAFALLADGKFTAIGNRSALESSADELVRELLRMEVPAGAMDTDASSSAKTN